MSGHFSHEFDDDPNNNSPTQQARVLLNVDNDKDEIASRRQPHRTPLYPKNADQYDYNIFRREICFTYNPRYRDQSRTSKKKITVFSSLNGAFKSTDKPINLYDKVLFAGIAGIDCKYDVRSEKNDRTGLPIALHGTDKIYNTGKQRIMAGDYVLFAFPDPKTSGNMPNVPGRLVAETVPYRPHDAEDKNHTIFSENINELLISAKSRKKSADFEDHDRTRTEDAVMMLRDSTYEAALVLITLLIQSNILKVNPDYLDKNRDSFDDVNPDFDEDQKEQFLEKIMGNLGLHGPKVEFEVTTDSGKEILDEYLDSALFSRDRHSRIYPGHALGVTHGAEAVVSQMQNNCIEFLLKGIEATNWHFKSRIIGRAMETADPMESFQIMLGHE
jgi:hypothetical protein